MKNVKRFIKENKIILTILLVSFIIRIALLFKYHEIWWDSAVYINMGKYLFSLGNTGLWEHIRPIIWPMILGLVWKIKLNPIIFGRLLELFFSISIIYLTYIITKEIFNKKTAVFSSILISFSSIFFFMGFRLYTEIPALFFLMLSLYLFIKKRYFISGILIGITFLTKFPAGLFLICFLIYFLKEKTINWKNTFYYMSGFIIVVCLFFISNYLFYHSIFSPLIDAKIAITKVLGCNYLRPESWHFYIINIFKDNFLNIFAVLGLYFSFKQYKRLDKKILIIFLSLILPLIYFSQLNCKDYRYMILFLPFLVMFSGYGLYNITKNYKKTYPFVLFIVLIISIIVSLNYYNTNEQRIENEIVKEYFKYLEKQDNISGEIWVSNPLVGLYTDKKIFPIYYPVYDKELALSFQDYLKENKEKIEYIFLDTCGGGIMCLPDDSDCLLESENMITIIKENFEEVFYKEKGDCLFYIFQNKN